MIIVALLSWGIWVFLLLFWGGFWRCDIVLPDGELGQFPPVCVIVPARNEADVLPITLRSLLQQDYPGKYQVVLVDDHSNDNTASIATEIAESLGKSEILKILTSQPLPSGWTGKLWAMEQGLQWGRTLDPIPAYFFLTDADIDRDKDNLQRLVAHAQQGRSQLTSLMVLLRCQSFWEKLLIPAFVFFFQKLYPFAWVNNPQQSWAAAAGGCTLLSRAAVERLGSLATIKDAIIDDCTLAQAVKTPPTVGGTHQKIWLGLTKSAWSLRPYDSLATIWDMVARSAYAQLQYSPFLLIGTLLGMMLVYLVPIAAIIVGIGGGNGLLLGVGISTWLLMSFAYWPTLRFYNRGLGWALTLPAIALFYTAMTLDSALRHYQGRGGMWKGRSYSG
ncbi:MAG: glycosyltransferase [Jaaginema sp. PMC 1079.18]|nr:glycosyltransferase [Jaaginema sp. PMC 1080.18]MEC4849805.1 glycosyltransferase [Jaaginema sp. PMC 1079.18]MEC4866887.1 glycosyltransferase [Jaaginema sp. PMC 1078.18]